MRLSKPWTVLCAVLALWAVGASSASAQARTVRMAGASGVDRVFAILLPRSYESSPARYPVVYLFHGGGQDHTAFMARTFFAPMARQHEFIVVMPAVDRTYGAAGPEMMARYHAYVADDLVTYVDTHYRTIASREGRAIAGLSMGGRVATLTGLARGDRFGVIGSFSPALRGDVEAAVGPPAADNAPYVHLACGDADSLLSASRALAALLDRRGVPHAYHERPGLGHEWAFWDREIATFFDALAARGFRAEGVQARR